MATEAATGPKSLTVAGFKVEIVRKDIKNLHLGVYPPHGRVRVAVPLVISDDAVRLAVLDKLGWVRRQRARFAAQPRQSAREMVNGESHYFLGRRLRLRVHEHEGPPHVALRGIASLDLFVRPGTDTAAREAVLLGWQRERLRALVQPMVEHWQAVLGVEVSAWGIKQMKTRWGSCNPATRRIWINLELAKKPAQCAEYIVVHELMHLLERHHDARFTGLMDLHMPQWRQHRVALNAAPLGAADWAY